MNLKEALIDPSTAELIEKAATKGAYAASGVTIISGLTINEWGVVAGIATAVFTAAFNVWFKMKYQRHSDEERN